MTKILTLTPAKYEKVFREDGEVDTILITEATIEEKELTEAQAQEFENGRQQMHLQGTTAFTRSQRDALLSESDKLMLADIWETFSLEKQQAIKNYRQALRDLPQQEGFPFNVVFPEKP